jgi:hypothetical protein
MQFLKMLFVLAIALFLLFGGAGLSLLSIVVFTTEDQAIARGVLGFGLLCLFTGLGLCVLALWGRRATPPGAATRPQKPFRSDNAGKSPFPSTNDQGPGGGTSALDDWKKARRTYLTRTDLWATKTRYLFDASVASRTVTIRYNSGDDPGSLRRIVPKQLFKVKGNHAVYLLAYDVGKQEERNFKVRYIELE